MEVIVRQWLILLRAVLRKTVCRRDSGTRAYRDDFTACLPGDGPAAWLIRNTVGHGDGPISLIVQLLDQDF